MSEKRIIGWTSMEFNFEVNDDDEPEFEVDYEDDEDAQQSIVMKLPKVLNTPLGLYKVDDTLNPFRYFDFWMGSCNFDITPKILKKLEVIPGVEKLRILTRYSFMIAVGRMFNFRDIRVAIQDQLCCTPEDEQITIASVKTKTELLEHYEVLRESKYWAALVLPNGAIETASADDLNDEFLGTVELFKQSRDSCDSVLFCSDEALLGGD